MSRKENSAHFHFLPSPIPGKDHLLVFQTLSSSRIHLEKDSTLGSHLLRDLSTPHPGQDPARPRWRAWFQYQSRICRERRCKLEQSHSFTQATSFKEHASTHERRTRAWMHRLPQGRDLRRGCSFGLAPPSNPSRGPGVGLKVAIRLKTNLYLSALSEKHKIVLDSFLFEVTPQCPHVPYWTYTCWYTCISQFLLALGQFPFCSSCHSASLSKPWTHLSHCCGVNCVPPPNSYMGLPSPQCDCIWRRVIQVKLSHKAGP